MGKQAVLVTILLFLIVVDGASATFLWNFRKLVSSVVKEGSDGTVSPNPSPSPVSGDDKFKDKLVMKSPPPETAKKGKRRGEEKDEAKAKEPLGSNETCNVGNQYCRDRLSMLACIQAVDDVKKVLVVLIQNVGENNLKVDIRIPTSQEKLQEIEVPKHQSEKINISLNVVHNLILLDAGNGDCTLQRGLRVTKGNLFKSVPSYTDLMTPIYGAYFLLLATLVALGVFACCKFRKRRRGEIPYQELEMSGMPEATTANVETAEGWDQGWDDDWDGDKAIKSSAARHPGSVSANGLTARSSNRDSWEEWDD